MNPENQRNPEYDIERAGAIVFSVGVPFYNFLVFDLRRSPDSNPKIHQISWTDQITDKNERSEIAALMMRSKNRNNTNERYALRQSIGKMGRGVVEKDRPEIGENFLTLVRLVDTMDYFESEDCQLITNRLKRVFGEEEFKKSLREMHAENHDRMIQDAVNIKGSSFFSPEVLGRGHNIN